MKNKCSKELSHSSEDEEESDKSVIDVDNSSKFIPIFKLPEKLKTKKIIINISDTHYPIVE